MQREVRAAPIPESPPPEERDRHNIMHMPFKPWRKDRVKGKATTPAHKKIKRTKRTHRL